MKWRFRTVEIAAWMMAADFLLLPVLSCTSPTRANEEPITIDAPKTSALATGIFTLQGHVRPGLFVDSGYVRVNGCTTNLQVLADTGFEQVIVLDLASNNVTVRLFSSTDTLTLEQSFATSEPCTFLTQQLLNTALAAGMTITPGNEPWNVEGRYFADALDCIASNYNSILVDSAVSNYSFRFTGQEPNRPIIIDQLASTGADSIEQGKGFVIGRKDEITLFFYEDHEIRRNGEIVPVVWSRILSASVEARGLTNCRIAAILANKGDDPNRLSVPVGSVRLYREMDDLAERVAAYPYGVAAKKTIHRNPTMAEDN